MTTNKDNSARGRTFEGLVGKYLVERGDIVQPGYSVEVGLNRLWRKAHKFDWGNNTLLVECKDYDWTSSHNIPSAKISTLKEAMLYFMAAPQSHRKMLFIRKTEGRTMTSDETLGEYFVRLYGHLIPEDVEVHELDDNDLSVRQIWPH